MPLSPASKIERRLPSGRKLPARFDEFVDSGPPVSVEWNSFKDYGFKSSAAKEATPFVRLRDGGLIAFWFREATTPIIHIGGEGELDVIAVDFENFLKAVNTRATGLSDLDDAHPPLRVAGVKGPPRRKEIASLQKELRAWFDRHTSMLKASAHVDAEKLRKRAIEIARAMLGDGKSKVYRVDSHWWSMRFQIQRSNGGLELTYLDYGKWFKVPKKYKLEQLVVELLDLVKHKNRKRYKLSVSSYGGVSVDADTELLLLPPDDDRKRMTSSGAQ